MLALFYYQERRGFKTQHLSYIQLITSDVLFYCEKSKHHDSTSIDSTSKTILSIYIAV